MSVVATTSVQYEVIETLAGGEKLITRHSPNASRLDAATSPPATKSAGGVFQLTAGALTLDLTAILNPSPGGGTVTFLGLKAQRVRITPLVATSRIVFANGATNGYALFAASAGKIDLAQGELYLGEFLDSRPDVATDAKTIDVTSPDADATFRFDIVAG